MTGPLTIGAVMNARAAATLLDVLDAVTGPGGERGA